MIVFLTVLTLAGLMAPQTATGAAEVDSTPPVSDEPVESPDDIDLVDRELTASTRVFCSAENQGGVLFTVEKTSSSPVSAVLVREWPGVPREAQQVQLVDRKIRKIVRYAGTNGTTLVASVRDASGTTLVANEHTVACNKEPWATASVLCNQPGGPRLAVTVGNDGDPGMFDIFVKLTVTWSPASAPVAQPAEITVAQGETQYLEFGVSEGGLYGLTYEEGHQDLQEFQPYEEIPVNCQQDSPEQPTPPGTPGNSVGDPVDQPVGNPGGQPLAPRFTG